MQQIYVGKDHDDGYNRPREHSIGFYESLGRLLPGDDDIVSADYDFYRKVNQNVADLRFKFLYKNGVAPPTR